MTSISSADMKLSQATQIKARFGNQGIRLNKMFAVLGDLGLPVDTYAGEEETNLHGMESLSAKVLATFKDRIDGKLRLKKEVVQIIRHSAHSFLWQWLLAAVDKLLHFRVPRVCRTKASWTAGQHRRCRKVAVGSIGRTCMPSTYAVCC